MPYPPDDHLLRSLALETTTKADEARVRSQLEEGKAWLERAEAYAQVPGQEFHAALMAMRTSWNAR